MTGYLHVFMTGERVTPESAEHGDAEERGWVDPRWSTRVFHDSRNDAGSVLSVSLDDPDLEEQVRDALDTHLGAFEDNGDGTFYGVDGEDDYETGAHYSYALHFVRKSFDGVTPPNGYVEAPWHPADAGIDLTVSA
jgi:hypothetical protein